MYKMSDKYLLLRTSKSLAYYLQRKNCKREKTLCPRKINKILTSYGFKEMENSKWQCKKKFKRHCVKDTDCNQRDFYIQ